MGNTVELRTKQVGQTLSMLKEACDKIKQAVDLLPAGEGPVRVLVIGSTIRFGLSYLLPQMERVFNERFPLTVWKDGNLLRIGSAFNDGFCYAVIHFIRPEDLRKFAGLHPTPLQFVDHDVGEIALLPDFC